MTLLVSENTSLKSPHSSQDIQENTSCEGFSQRRSRAIGNPSAWSSSSFQNAKSRKFSKWPPKSKPVQGSPPIGGEQTGSFRWLHVTGLRCRSHLVLSR